MKTLILALMVSACAAETTGETSQDMRCTPGKCGDDGGGGASAYDQTTDWVSATYPGASKVTITCQSSTITINGQTIHGTTCGVIVTWNNQQWSAGCSLWDDGDFECGSE